MSLHCFFSGALGGGAANLARVIEACEDRLLSIHGAYFRVAQQWLRAAHDHRQASNREIMLDSGAFSAWNAGGEAHLEDVVESYSELIVDYSRFYRDFWLINLDKIPGAPGRSATAAEIAEAIEISDENFAKLTEKFGPRVLPVFHQDETPDRLDVVLAQNPRYICVSPRNDLPEEKRRDWAARVHQRTGPTWTHGLAATGTSMMRDVPWRSIDSAAWTQVAGYGIVRLFINGAIRPVYVSEEHSSFRDLKRHAAHFVETDRRIVEAALAECGVSYEEAAKSYDARAYATLFHYAKFARSTHVRKPHVQQTLFDL